MAEEEKMNDQSDIDETDLLIAELGTEKQKEETKPEEEDSEIVKKIRRITTSPKKKKEAKAKDEEELHDQIFALRTTANREDQVMDFIQSNVAKKKMKVYALVRPHGMRGYIFIEAETRQEAEQAAFNVPYARGLLPNVLQYKEIEHMLEQVKLQMNIEKNDIVEIISGPFKRENAKITRIDRAKEEVVVELLESAVPIPITVKMDSVKVIRRDTQEAAAEEEEDEIEEF